jgi:hypothetical protein
MLAGMDTNGPSHRPPPGPGRERSVWATIGIALVVVLCIGGLVVVGGMVLLVVAMSQMGSNK